MTTAVNLATATAPPIVFQVKPAGKTRKISWAEFQKKYLDREDGFKYEWVGGEAVKSKHMDYTQFFILDNLLNFFERISGIRKIQGRLIPEGDIFFGENHRRPDLAYLTDGQITRTAYGKNQVPKFVIEVISTKDQMNLVHDKMGNYRTAGVEVVWHIFPKINEVHVYTGLGLKKMTVCTGGDICSAAPVLPDFEISADAIFQKPPMPDDL